MSKANKENKKRIKKLKKRSKSDKGKKEDLDSKIDALKTRAKILDECYLSNVPKDLSTEGYRKQKKKEEQELNEEVKERLESGSVLGALSILPGGIGAAVSGIAKEENRSIKDVAKEYMEELKQVKNLPSETRDKRRKVDAIKKGLKDVYKKDDQQIKKEREKLAKKIQKLEKKKKNR